jgi:nucleoside-diphosphate-sugar epimerase
VSVDVSRDFPPDGSEMFRVNVAGAWALLDYAVETGVSRFCPSSSGTLGPVVADPAGVT